jgi:hypothetical protein
MTSRSTSKLGRLASALIALGLVAGACGGDDGDDGVPPIDAPDGVLENPGFPVPTATTKANMKVGAAWTEIGDADWTCLNTPSADQPATQAIALSGRIEDFQTGNGVGPATVTAFPGIELGGNAGTTTTSDVAATRGQYTMNLAMLPSGTTRYGFKFEAPSYVKTYLLNQYLDPTMATQTRNMDAVSDATATALPAFIGVDRDVTKGVLAGAFRDCAGREVSNAVATVSSTSTTVDHLTGAQTYYFSAGSSSLPVRHNVSGVMNKDGLFVILDLPPQTAPAFVQVWGFVDAADLADGQMTLLSELASPVEANAVITGSFEPLRN